MRQRLEMRAAEEEDMMTRVPLSREQVNVCFDAHGMLVKGLLLCNLHG